MAQRDREHLVGRRHFEVERDRQLLGQPRDIVVGDMAPILAQMRGDAVCARLGGEQRRAHRIGIARATRVAHRRDVIDVDAEAQRAAHTARLPGLIAGIAASSGGKASAA